MVGLLGIATAGAVRGARDVSNANVEADREALRQKYERQYEDFKYQRSRKDAKEDAAAAAKSEEQIYQRGRADTLADKEDDRKFRASESAKDRASRKEVAGMRAGGKGAGGAGDAKSGIRSTLGKEISDLLDQGLADSPEEALDILDQRGLIKGVAANQFIDDPKQVFELFEDIKRERGLSKKKAANPQDTYLDFDPKTGFK